MVLSSSAKKAFQWNTYLLHSSLDPIFSNQLTCFLEKFEGEWKTHFEHARYELCQLESGNRLRPIIAFFGFLISEKEYYLTAEDFNKIVKVGVCVELIHKTSLIIDDMVDGDSLRNGKTTFHIANGQEKAIAVTSHLISKSLKLLIEVLKERNISESTSLTCLEISINILNDMSTGLLKELSMAEIDFSSIKLTEEIIRTETSSIIKNSLLIGYVIRGGINRSIINCLNEIGESCGYIFQVLNDIEPYRQGSQYKTHKGKEELEFFHDRKNTITTFILQLMSPKEKETFYLCKDKKEGHSFLFHYFSQHNIYEHFILEIEDIKKNIAMCIETINNEGINPRWCLNCQSFINSLTEVAVSRCS